MTMARQGWPSSSRAGKGAQNSWAYKQMMVGFPGLDFLLTVDSSCSKQQPGCPPSDAKSKKSPSSPSSVLFLPQDSRDLPPPDFRTPPLFWSSII
ncbi:hypothetical protein DUI87_10996 [Hirundo rustica rustica]|uniref:Uncharacterized protein n=1 Tax=Hirundo rustica rustica TaxID=333673 RepID=A0A3M0KJM4_HIRRU|nr:hypothetical protein DUI87_10996 [Hirundo rustica rustica]